MCIVREYDSAFFNADLYSLGTLSLCFELDSAAVVAGAAEESTAAESLVAAELAAAEDEGALTVVELLESPPIIEAQPPRRTRITRVINHQRR
jgi:hypothetical protein